MQKVSVLKQVSPLFLVSERCPIGGSHTRSRAMSASTTLILTLLMTLPTAEGLGRQGIAHKTGNITLGGFFFVHYKKLNTDECGDFSPLGLGHAQAMIYAIEKINRNSKLLPNTTLGYQIHNYCESSSLAMRYTLYDIVKKTDPHFDCHDDKNRDKQSIAALIGPADSGSAVLVGSLLGVAGIPSISYAATSEELSSPLYKHFFRTVPPDRQQAKAMADLIEYFNWSYVASVAVDDSYGRYGVWALEKESYVRKTFCIAMSEYIPRLDYISKLRIIVSKLKLHSNIKVVILWLFGGYGRAFLREAEKQDLLDVTWVLSDALAAEEAAILNPYFSVLHGSLGVQPHYFRDHDFETFLKDLTPNETRKRGVPWWDEFWEMEFNCSAGLCQENKTLSETAIRKLYDTYLPYVIDAVNATAHALHAMYECETSSEQLSGTPCPDVWHSGRPSSDLELYLKNVSFEGLTGRVQFDEYGNPLTSSYDIINFHRDNRNRDGIHLKRLVGSWEGTRLKRLFINDSEIKWHGSGNWTVPVSMCRSQCSPGFFQTPTTPCCWDCVKCPSGTFSSNVGATNCTECPSRKKSNNESTSCVDLPIVNVSWKSSIAMVMIGFTSLGQLLTSLSFLIFLKYRNTPIVKACNRELTFLLLTAIFAYFGLVYLTLAKPTDFFCRITPIWRSISIATCVSLLLLKTIRILNAFDIRLMIKHCNVEIKSILVVLLNIVSVSVLAFWILLDPPSQDIIQSRENILLTCLPHRTMTGLALHAANCGSIAILSLVTTYYAFKVRRLPENFNEGRYIGFAMYILLLAAIAYYPVEFGVEGWNGTIVTCTTTLVSSYGLLGSIYAPKLYVILRRPERNTALAVRSQVSNYTFSRTKAPVNPKTEQLGNSNPQVQDET